MRFLTNTRACQSALEADKNYPNGHIYRLDGSPAVFICKNKIDLGLAACRDQIMQDTMNNNGWNATVYGRTNNEYNPLARSTFSTNTRNQIVRAAYNSLDIALREQVLPHCMCRGFKFYDMIMARGNTDAFIVHRRQHLVYRLNDHFDNPNVVNGVKGHADDSLYHNGWVRNDVDRTFVGLLYLTTQREGCDQDSGTEFSGGDLRFPMISEDASDKEYSYHPKFSEMIIFPASPLYLHAVPKVTAGTRIVVTTWWTIPGYN